MRPLSWDQLFSATPMFGLAIFRATERVLQVRLGPRPTRAGGRTGSPRHNARAKIIAEFSPAGRFEGRP